jgi:hypothetical protein
MPDLFISYKRADRSRVEPLVDALNNEGFSVWWDPEIVPGDRFSRTIERQLSEAKCVIVAWSESSVDSVWVHDEAASGLERDILLQLSLDGVKQPMGYRQFQMVDFKDWNGNVDDPLFQQLIAGIRSKIDGSEDRSSVRVPGARGIQAPRFFRQLFDKSSGRSVHLKEFPSLFTMEGHTGTFGAFFVVIWLALAVYLKPQLLTNIAFDVSAVAILLLFIVLGGWSFQLSSRYYSHVEEIETLRRDSAEAAAGLEKKRDVWARIWIVFLSTAYAVLCCVLIWLTGGVYSPFMPFYVMIFTLTIERNKVPNPGVLVLIFFLIAIVIACAAAVALPSPIGLTDLFEILLGIPAYVVATIFICFSLIVPTVSSFLIENEKERERLRERERLPLAEASPKGVVL